MKFLGACPVEIGRCLHIGLNSEAYILENLATWFFFQRQWRSRSGPKMTDLNSCMPKDLWIRMDLNCFKYLVLNLSCFPFLNRGQLLSQYPAVVIIAPAKMQSGMSWEHFYARNFLFHPLKSLHFNSKCNLFYQKKTGIWSSNQRSIATV